MVKHLHIAEKETSLWVKHICLNRSEIRRRDPYLPIYDLKVDKAALYVTNHNENKYNVQAFQLTFRLHSLVQIGNQFA